MLIIKHSQNRGIHFQNHEKSIANAERFFVENFGIILNFQKSCGTGAIKKITKNSLKTTIYQKGNARLRIHLRENEMDSFNKFQSF